MSWRTNVAFRRREFRRTLEKAIDRGARLIHDGADPKDVIARVAAVLRTAKVNLTVLELLAARAAEIESEEDAW